MYESFYGLKEKPFTLLPDPEYLYLSPKHQRALTLLEYGMMNQAGFSVICGDTGAGKTTLIRRLLAELEDDTTVGLITNTHQSFGELLNWVLMAFGLDSEGMSKSQMHQAFIQFLIEQYARNKHAVLIVDEAQNMNAETLEELRMLSNINADKDQVLQVILAGQPALRETLRKPELMQFAQRIAVDYYLESLSREETRSYIQHRLKVAGASDPIFTDAACDTIYKFSGGTPRLINLLCDTSLVYGFAEQNPQINAELVEDVVREQHAHSIVPTFNMPHKENNQQKPVKVEQPLEALSETEQSSANPAQEELETAIAELGQRARQAVSNFDSAARAVADEVRETIRETADEFRAEPGRESKVTPIHQDVSMDDYSSHQNDGQVDDRSTPKKASDQKPEQENKQPANTQSDDIDDRRTSKHNDNDDEQFIEDDIFTGQETEASSGDYEPSHHRSHRQYEDTYPIIQVDNTPRKNTSYLILGIAGGMFAATIVMVIAGYFLFFNSSLKFQQEQLNRDTATAETRTDRESQQAMEKSQLQALEKERDAALAITRALERERDAALAAAKAQEEMRAAERRAAEMVAQQERRTSLEIQRARELARQAEIAAAKAKERERLAKQQAEQARVEAEKAKAAVQSQSVVSAAPTPVPVEVTSPQAQPEPEPLTSTPVATDVKPAAGQSKKDAATKFSANPCNSASAKFLSTCKK